jgi:8-oxo-dGTP diphosphatase
MATATRKTYTRLDNNRSVPTRVTPSEQPPKHSVSVAAAIINDDGRFLAIRRADNGRWEPPGGVLELHESIEQGLIREVAEETGLRIEPVALTGVYKNMQRGIVALVFRCTIVGHTRWQPDEVDDVGWLTPGELSQMSEAYRVRLLDALDPGSPHVRAHDGVDLLERPPVG